MNKPHLNENGEWRYETVHHMGRRLPGWDYRQRAIYIITIVVEDRAKRPLGRLVVRKRASDVRSAPSAQADGWLPLAATCGLDLKPDEVEAKVIFSELGRAVFAHFKRIREFTPEVDPLYCEIMPDHAHLVLFVEREMRRPLGQVIAGFKTGSEKLAAGLGFEGRLWAEGFVDQIVFRQGQLAAEFAYLHDNPRRLAIKRLFPDLFRVVGELRVNLRLAPQGLNGPGALNSGDSKGLAVCRAPAALAVGSFMALGNRFLLDRPLAQVQVSRRFFRYKRVSTAGGGLKIARDKDGEPVVEYASPEYEAKRAELLAAAARGQVLISPCVSDGERQIAREALCAGAKLITLQNKGFSPLKKPGGRLFDACSEGRLLLLAPIAWPYQPGEKPMTRADATALNRLCQWLAGQGAAEINYHGLQPANIDALARAAVCGGSR